MVRVHHARPQRSVTLDQSRAAPRKKKPYKILLEAVTQEKKKLRSTLTYASHAPTGFRFVATGHSEFTEWCKEQCRQRNLDVHIVSAKPKSKMYVDPEKLSYHVHRVGIHFPVEIINLACSKFGYIYDEIHGLRKARASQGTGWIAQRVEDYSSRQLLEGRTIYDEPDPKAYIYGAVREMFPKIPEDDLSSIVNHAFEEGSDRVGNAKGLSLARRVQLAVVAHIRHNYTKYDLLLRTDGWVEARQQVEHVSLDKLKEWRDETGEQSNEFEEIFREVIVLDDDEDDDEASSDDVSSSNPEEREQSIEIVSSRAIGRDLQPERYADHPRIDDRDMMRVPRTIVVHRYPPPPRPAARDEAYHLAHSRPIDPRTRPARSQLVSRSAQPLMSEIDGRLYQLQPIGEPRGYPKVEYDPPLRAAPRHAQDGYVHPPPPPSIFDRPAHARRASEQDLVLPSVEREVVDLTSPPRVASIQRPLQAPVSLSRANAEVPSPKRQAFLTFQDDRQTHPDQSTEGLRQVYREDQFHSRFEAYQGGLFQPFDVHSRPRAQPQQPVLDLTYSPYKPPTSDDRGHYVPARSYPAGEPSGHTYVPVSSRRSPMREARGAYVRYGDQ